MKKTHSTIPVFCLKDLIESKDIRLINDQIFIFEHRESSPLENMYHHPTRLDSLGMVMILKGKVTLKIDSHPLTLVEHDFITLFPHNVIEFLSLSEDFESRGILISFDLIADINFMVHARETFDFLHNYAKVIKIDAELSNVISYHFHRINQINDPEKLNVYQKDLLKNHIILFLLEIMNFNKMSSAQYDLYSCRKEDIAIQFMNLVATNFRKHRDVEYYAETLFLTRKHLTRTIKEVMVKTPKRIIEDKIIAEAKILLLDSKLNINQVVEELNFADHSVFSKFFKNNTGISPREYRSQNENPKI